MGDWSLLTLREIWVNSKKCESQWVPLGDNREGFDDTFKSLSYDDLKGPWKIESPNLDPIIDRLVELSSRFSTLRLILSPRLAPSTGDTPLESLPTSVDRLIAAIEHGKSFPLPLWYQERTRESEDDRRNSKLALLGEHGTHSLPLLQNRLMDICGRKRRILMRNEFDKGPGCWSHPELFNRDGWRIIDSGGNPIDGLQRLYYDQYGKKIPENPPLRLRSHIPEDDSNEEDPVIDYPEPISAEKLFAEKLLKAIEEAKAIQVPPDRAPVWPLTANADSPLSVTGEFSQLGKSKELLRARYDSDLRTLIEKYSRLEGSTEPVRARCDSILEALATKYRERSVEPARDTPGHVNYHGSC
ncbi:hypothetical protein ABW19_dt0202626 [Dactylella cylindrospora]|nr:hypothetical protein ABW19_dt0202626 [Dactylella cylindrospora]